MRYKLAMSNEIKNLYLISHGNKVNEISDSFLKFTGYSKYEIINMDVSEVFTKLLRLRNEKYIQIEKTGQTECFVFTKSLEVREVKISLSLGEDKNVKIYYIKEKPQSRLEEKFIYAKQLCLDNKSAIAIFSTNLILLKANQKFINYLEEPLNKEENCLGLYQHEIFKGIKGCEVIELLRKVVSTGESFYAAEFTFNSFDRDRRYWDASIIPIFDKGKVKYLINRLTEVTERVLNRMYIEEQNKIIEEQNVQLKKAIEIKDEFLTLITHEFKTPITVINSAIQAMELLCKNELSEKGKGFLRKIRQNSLRQLRLANNLLDIARISSGHIKIIKENHDIVFLTKAIVESIFTYTQQKGVYLSFSTKLERKVIGIDDEKFERILLNLLSNAIKFTPEGKRILVTLSVVKGFISIKVKDEGIGIPEDKQVMIFERFGQVDSSLSRQAEGSGIGLSLVKMLVDALGGSISLRSKERKGSTFNVLIPNEKASQNMTECVLPERCDNRLTQATAIEFSDIYLK